MSVLFSAIKSKTLRNVQIQENASAPSVLALSDAGSYANERARDVWKRRLWREFIILGTYTVPASTQAIALSSIVPHTSFSTSANGYNATFFEISAIREGSNPLGPQDPSAINMISPAAWEANGTPVRFVNRGQQGIFLLGSFSVATELSFFGKANVQDITSAETWILDPNGQALIEGATGDLYQFFRRDEPAANRAYAKYESEIVKLVEAQDVQGANSREIVISKPWNYDAYGDSNTSPTGIGRI
jgi:hypothetical protein